MKIKKVMHIITRMDMGGSSQNTLLTCLGMDKQKFQVVLVFGPSMESNMTAHEFRIVARKLKLAEADGVKIILIPSLIRKIAPAQDAKAILQLYRIIRKEKPDIVHTHTSKAGILGRWAAWLARVPFIAHTPHGHVFFGHFGEKASRLFFIIEKVTEPITHRIVALTKGERKDYVQFFLTSERKLVTIHSGVDVGRFINCQSGVDEKRISLGLSPDSMTVGLVGWLLPIKGPMILLEAMEGVWRKFPDIRLVYVGKGDMEEELRSTALRMGRSGQVHFLGWRDDMPEIMQTFDIVVLPSLNEGMGRVVVEAMAASKPVIGSNVGGIPDLIEDGVNGFLFPSGDTAALSHAICRLVEDKGLRHQMGMEGKKRAERFDISHMIRQIEMMYDELSK